MSPADKIKSAGVDGVAATIGRSTSVVYRWIKALEAGERISDRSMRELIAATAHAPQPIAWSDFDPNPARAAA
jgi:transposase-like protein